jgi:ketosteroid isomerase-like protein
MRKTIIAITAFFLVAGVGLTVKAQDEAVKATLSTYKNAIEKLDTTGTGKLFVKKSIVVESGSIEGSYQDYVHHHLGPELKDFKSFKFNNYKVDVQLISNVAVAIESYEYEIVARKDGAVYKRKGVATSVLINDNGIWKIVNTHSSSRK